MKFGKERRRYLKRRITVLHGLGLSHKEIAVKLRISESSVHRLKDKQTTGVVFFKSGNGRSNKDTRKVACRLVRFLGVDLTAWAFGVSPKTVTRWRAKERINETEIA